MRNCCNTHSYGKCLTSRAPKAPEEAQNSDTVVQEELSTPLVDIVENDKEFVIVADMPGADSDTIEVQFNEGELTILGEVVAQENDGEEVEYSCLQFDPQRYFRNFRIGETINSEGITADYNDGVLTVHLPKREEIQPRKISISKKASS